MTEIRKGDLLAGKYVVDGELGRGGMGIVFSASHVILGTRVALKVLRDEDNQPQRTQRFLREARIAAGLKSEHVVRVFDMGELADGRPYMAMEQLEGQDWEELLGRRGRLPAEEAVSYLLPVISALSEAHESGVVHRDLKPSNLFLCPRRDGSVQVKVMDFGVCKVMPRVDLTTLTTASTQLIGTPHYMSPEQLRAASDVDERSDVWALGVILYRMLAGKLPFDGATLPELCAAIIGAPPEPLTALNPSLPPALVAVVERCLDKQREQRLRSASLLGSELAPFARSVIKFEPSEAESTSATPPSDTLATLTHGPSLPLAPKAKRTRAASALLRRLALPLATSALLASIAWTLLRPSTQTAATSAAAPPPASVASTATSRNDAASVQPSEAHALPAERPSAVPVITASRPRPASARKQPAPIVPARPSATSAPSIVPSALSRRAALGGRL